MTSFHRSGHFRVSANGNMHWVSDHDVSRYSYSDSKSFKPRETKPNELSFFPVDPRRIESYTRPNARCPICGSIVYFYQSVDGGRVFFDDLGPPWPKHPCMDNPSLTVMRFRPVENKPSQCQWRVNGWTPAREFKFFKRHELDGIYEVVITRPDLCKWDGYRFFFKCSADLMNNIPLLAHYKPDTEGGWRVSFWLKELGEIQVLAYEELPAEWTMLTAESGASFET